MNGPVVRFSGRLLLVLIFVLSGFGQLAAFNSTVAAATAHGVPLPQFAVCLAIFVEIVCGLMLLFGYEPGIASGALLLFLALATFFFHFHDWQVADDPVAKMDQFFHIMKNLALAGGVLYVGSVESAETKQETVQPA
jgi:putative oxidoreductase